ncbi:MAG: toll/interleukin-1 receptor domain-containing protein [Pseudomonadota bacterium]
MVHGAGKYLPNTAVARNRVENAPFAANLAGKKGGDDMAYDVFLAYAQADRDMAALVARRLRALKFKVRFSKREEDPTFDDKDARDALKSQSMLVIWSEAALTSDWVRAAASIGHSRPGTLIQTVLDDTVPYEPFQADKRYPLAGFTSRTTVEGWYNTVEELGRRDGRRDLRAWIDIPKKDEDAKTAWLEAHPTDPLARHAEAQKAKRFVAKPAPAAAAAGAAALTASAIGQGRESNGGSVISSPAPATGSPKVAASVTDNTTGFDFIIPLVLAGIGLMLFLGYLWRSEPLETPAIANLRQVVGTCPAGTVPENLIAPPILEPGPIINDTE